MQNGTQQLTISKMRDGDGFWVNIGDLARFCQEPVWRVWEVYFALFTTCPGYAPVAWPEDKERMLYGTTPRIAYIHFPSSLALGSESIFFKRWGGELYIQIEYALEVIEVLLK